MQTKKKIKGLEEELELEIIKLNDKFNSDMKKLLAARNKRLKEEMSEEQIAKFEKLFGETLRSDSSKLHGI